jgi:small subunit ribosomal protein S11
MGKKFNRKKKVQKVVSQGKVFIQSTFNNTIITVTDLQGNTLSWASAGSTGFKGAKKSTPYAAQIAARHAIEKAKQTGLEMVDVLISGVGAGREQAVRALPQLGLRVSSIKDVTPIPHNGCRPKKIRRT